MEYNNPNTTPSDVGEQIRIDHYDRKAVITAGDEMYFMPLASAKDMPKHFGKTIKIYEYYPLLDDRNVNDQGIDATGATIADGNIYGSSKDVGNVTSRMPTLDENGGKVNRVGYTRVTHSATLQNMGFYNDYTEDSLNFDTDKELMMHITREAVVGAVQLSEALLQLDLLNGSGITSFTGIATAVNQITGEQGVTPSLVTYNDLARLRVVLDENKTPKQTTVITGSRLDDTKTIQSARFAYIAPILENTIRDLADNFGNPAFVGVEQYQDAAKMVMNGEIGHVNGFRFIVVPEMFRYEGAGAAVLNNDGYTETLGNYDVHPILVIGDDSFATVGFNGFGPNGKSTKFDIKHRKPGEVYSSLDPYEKSGYYSIQWWYATLIKRPERIAKILTVAKL